MAASVQASGPFRWRLFNKYFDCGVHASFAWSVRDSGMAASAVVQDSAQQILTQTLIGETALGIGLAAPS